MNAFKRFGKTALNAASSTLNYVTPKVIKNKLRAFTNWLYDYVGPSDIDAVLNDTKDYIQSTYQGLKKFNFDDDLFGTDNTSIAEPFQLIESESALDGFVKQYTIKPQKNYESPLILQ